MMSDITDDNNAYRIFPKIYALIFFVGLLAPGLAYFNMVLEEPDTIKKVAALFFGFATLTLLILIYRDIERLDCEPVCHPDYPDWSGGLWERILRYLIIFSLLLLVGELVRAFEPWVQKISHFLHAEDGQPVKGICYCFSGFFSTVDGFITSEDPRRGVFGFGSCLSFFLIALWNIGALKGRLKERSNNALDSKSKSHRYAINVRISLFAGMASIKSFYWLMLLYDRSVAYALSNALISLFAATFFAFIFLVLFPDKVERFLMRLFPDQSAATPVGTPDAGPPSGLSTTNRGKSEGEG